MMDENTPQSELEKIKAALAALEATLTGDALETAQRPLLDKQAAILSGSGTILQGDHHTFLGEKAIQITGRVDGDVLGPDARFEKHYHFPEEASPEDLREAYLNRIVESAGRLSLVGVDRKAASEADAHLNLSSIYVGLFTNKILIDQELLDSLPPREARVLQLRYGLVNGKKADLAEIGARMGVSEGDVEEEEIKALARMQSVKNIKATALTLLNEYPRLVLLGEPGSGKSTFVSFVALCLAGEALERQDVNLELLTRPLPAPEDREDREKSAPIAQNWDHGPLLPVRIILRDFAASGLPAVGERATAKHLWAFIVAELQNAALGAFERSLLRELLNQGGLLLLDGLDEVPEANQRRVQIRQIVEDFAATFRRCRILVTSRTYAYQEQDWRLQGFEEAVLAPFSRGQIRQFVDAWYAHIAVRRNLDQEDARGRAELLKKAIFSSERLLELADRPLLLTLMASLHAWRGGSLPEKREELYADTVDLLLDWWESQRVVRDASGNIRVIQPSLAEWLKVDRDKVRRLLNALAYEAHASQVEMVGTADIPEGALISGLMRLSQNPEVNPARLVEYLSFRAGLLVPRGVGVFTFPHRTFQEYLAACHLTDLDYPDRVADLARFDPNRWREVALLAGAKAARGTASAIWSLAEALCFHDPPPDPKQEFKEADQWGTHLAGQALVESADLAQVSERNQGKLDCIRGGLVSLLGRGELPAVERALAGDHLGALGDSRFDPDHWHLPDEALFGFVPVLEGAFWMGSDPQQNPDSMEYETPQHQLDLPAFYIARYPVTVAQYRAFVTDAAYDFDRWKPNPKPNHPVVNVTWDDALAYCRWLGKKLAAESDRYSIQPGLNAHQKAFWMGLAEGSLGATLPSEAEWEKAARGHGDKRIFPWGDQADPNRANYEDTGIGATTAVGCFPGGASPYGVQDLCGNVDEWTRSLWGEDMFEPGYRYPYNPRDGRENLDASRNIPRVLRGGAFFDNPRLVRCASRDRHDPNLRLNLRGFRVVVSPFFN